MASKPHILGEEHKRVAIVTGGAGGIGMAVCRTLASAGLAIAVADIDRAGALATAQSIIDQGGDAIAIGVDIGDRASVMSLVAETVRRYDRLDVLVNNAAIIDYAPVLELTEAAWDRVIDVNLKGAFTCAQLAATAMIASGGGVIVNISSISAELPEPDCIHYGVSKAGIAYLTRTLALALAPHNIRVVALAPGTITTPMNRELLSDAAVVEARLSTIPLKRLGAPADVADALAFLVSDAARYVTGSTLYVEGGMMLVR